MSWTDAERIDPLTAFMDGAVVSATQAPIPQVSAAIAIEIHGALAAVKTTRIFRNVEDRSIEAVITFPTPVQAAVYSLSAKVGERTHNAVAQARSDARTTYEGAVDRGRTAILHEEVLRGVHTLSIAHIGPNDQIEICYSYVQALSCIGQILTLQAPMTVGDIFGRSPLNDVDALKTDGTLQHAMLTVVASADVRCDGVLLQGPVQVPLNRPIMLTLPYIDPPAMRAITASGERLEVTFRPLKPSRASLNLAILVDRSGSMASANGLLGRSKHQEAVIGLAEASRHMSHADRVQLWEFDDILDQVFSGPGAGLADACQKLQAPDGGTEIGMALTQVCLEPVTDVLVVTDGKSYAMDVHTLAQTGRRITAVLVGEDSLEANIGHLAALTDGDIYISGGEPLSLLIASAISGLRSHSNEDAASGKLIRRGGFEITAAPTEQANDQDQQPFARAVGAFIAFCKLRGLSEPDAMTLAQSEGIVTHLTSLVLVDEDGAVQAGLPELRKVPLSAPSFAASAPRAVVPSPMAPCSIAPSPRAESRAGPPSQSAAPSAGSPLYPVIIVTSSPSSGGPAADPVPLAGSSVGQSAPFVEERGGARPSRTRSPSMAGALKRWMRPCAPSPAAIDAIVIDWGRCARSLALGDLSRLPPPASSALKRRALDPKVIAASRRFECSAEMMAIALSAAESALAGDRSAARVVRAILGFDSRERLLALLGLVTA